MPKLISDCESHDSKILEQMDLGRKLLKEPVEPLITIQQNMIDHTNFLHQTMVNAPSARWVLDFLSLSAKGWT